MSRLWRFAEAMLAMLTVAKTTRLARTGSVQPGEERVFRFVNQAPDGAYGPVWLVMQCGSLAAVFVASGWQHKRGHADSATVSLVAGTAVWAGVKVIKPLVGRGRPEQHLDRVSVRGQAQSGLGYPSGHAAVSTVLALIASHHLGPSGRAVSAATAAATGVARMYVGAHLPLDVAGGAAIGVFAGRVATTVLDRS